MSYTNSDFSYRIDKACYDGISVAVMQMSLGFNFFYYYWYAKFSCGLMLVNVVLGGFGEVLILAV